MHLLVDLGLAFADELMRLIFDCIFHQLDMRFQPPLPTDSIELHCSVMCRPFGADSWILSDLDWFGRIASSIGHLLHLLAEFGLSGLSSCPG